MEYGSKWKLQACFLKHMDVEAVKKNGELAAGATVEMGLGLTRLC